MTPLPAGSPRPAQHAAFPAAPFQPGAANALVAVVAASDLTSTNKAAVGLRALGEYHRACALDEDILTRYRRVLGDDHPSTLLSANNLAADLRALGEREQARQLEEWIKSRYQS